MGVSLLTNKSINRETVILSLSMALVASHLQTLLFQRTHSQLCEMSLD